MRTLLASAFSKVQRRGAAVGEEFTMEELEKAVPGAGRLLEGGPRQQGQTPEQKQDFIDMNELLGEPESAR